MRINDTVYGGGIDLDVVGIERLPVAFQNPAEPIPIGAGDELFEAVPLQLPLLESCGYPLTPLRERARAAHLVAAFFTFLDTHGYAHELVRPAEIAVRFLDIHYIGDHSAAAAGN